MCLIVVMVSLDTTFCLRKIISSSIIYRFFFLFHMRFTPNPQHGIRVDDLKPLLLSANITESYLLSD
jgi:hypothetical protein